MSIGMLLIAVELVLMLIILLFVPRDGGSLLHRLRHRRVAGRRGAADRGGIFTKIADIGSD